MKYIEIPQLRATGHVVAVVIENVEVSGTAMNAVTVRTAPESKARRSWHVDPGQALAFAVEQADRHGLVLLDLREPAELP